MAQKISQLPIAASPLPPSTLFPTVIGPANYGVTLAQIRDNCTLTGLVTIPTAANSSNDQTAANTTWVRNHISSLVFPISQGGTGATTAAGAISNLGLGSIATQNSSNVTITGGKVDGTPIGSITPSTLAATSLSLNSVSVGTATLSIKGFASQTANLQEWRNASNTLLCNVDPNGVLNLQTGQGINFNFPGGTSNPISLTPYNINTNEYGLSAPRFQCTSGRFDMTASPDFKAEFRVTGATTSFNLYNITNQNHYVQFKSDQSIDTYGEYRQTVGGTVVARINNSGITTNSLTTPSITSTSIAATNLTVSNTFTLTNALSISNGGTGANNAASARSNLGTLGSRYSSRTSAYTLVGGDAGTTFDCNASGGAFTLTLPASSTNAGFVCVVRKTDNSLNLVTIAGAGSDTVNGSASVTLSNQFQSLILLNNGNGTWVASVSSLSTFPIFNANQIQSRGVASTTPTAGQVLGFNGTQWTPQVAGKVLQVVYGFTATQVSNTTSTFVDTGLSASITPMFSTSRILVAYFVNGIFKTGANTSVNIQLVRNSTTITTTNSAFTGSTTDLAVGSSGNTILDAPASTSALTYKLALANNNNAGTVFAQYFGSSSSTLTLMEIAV